MRVNKRGSKGLALAAAILLVSCPGSALAREEVAILTPTHSDFAWAVGISGDDVVLGGFVSNTAYVFRRQGETWIEQGNIRGSDAGFFDGFGWSVAIDGDFVAVGAPVWEPTTFGPGKGYVFRREGNNWVQEARLISSGSERGDFFGYSVGISGDRVVVGAAETGSGSAYVFRREGLNWVEEARLTGGDVGIDWLGSPVAIDGELLVVKGSRPGGTQSGAIYVFTRQENTWIHNATLIPSDAEDGDRFGRSVAITGDHIVVAAPGLGAVYVFRRTHTGWIEEGKLTPSGPPGRFYGPVAIDGTLIVVGAPEDHDGGDDAGAAYLFSRLGTAWQQVDKLIASDAHPRDRLGLSVSVNGQFAVVGNAGRSAYVYPVGDAVFPPGIPTISAWGLMIMGLLLAAGGKIFFGRRKRLRGGRCSPTIPALLSALALFSTTPASAQAPNLTAPHHPEHILVRFKPQVADETAQLVNSAVGAVRLKKYRFVDGLYLVNAPAEHLGDALNDYLQRDEVLYAEPDYELTLFAAPNDPAFQEGKLWGLHNTGQTLEETGWVCTPVVDPDYGTDGADINAPEAWDLWTGDPDFRIAVFDSGIKRDHEDFFLDLNANGQLDENEPYNIWVNPGEDTFPPGGNGIVDGIDKCSLDPPVPDGDFNCVDDDGNGWVDDVYGYNFGHPNRTDPFEEHFHGTHVAGIIGAMANNLTGVAGINWRCKIVALKIIDPFAEEQERLAALASHAVEAFEYCIENGIRLSNHSWGVALGVAPQSLRDVIELSATFGHLLIIAAGNSEQDVDTEPVYPCSYDLPNIICVAATDNDDILADWGPGFGTNYGAMSVDLAAPGNNIYSTSSPPFEMADYLFCHGTSFSAPHVAGVVALVMARYYPLMSWEAVRDKVLMTVRTPIPDPNPLAGKTVTGGVVNAAAALDCNGNGVRDDCDIDCNAGGCEAPCTEVSVDSCNQNWIPDECEPDCDGNGTPDECDPWFPDPPAPEPTPNPKPRYISLLPGNAGQQTALRVTLTDYPQFPGHVGWQWWVGPPHEVCENAGQGAEDLCLPAGTCSDGSPCSINADCCAPAPGLPNPSFMAAPLQCQPHYTDWPAIVGSNVVLHVYGLATLDGSEVAPESTYKIQALHEPVDPNCNPPTEWTFSDPLTVTTSRWGDVCGPGPGGACSGGPDGIVDVTNDVLGVLNKFTNTIGLEKVRCDLEGTVDASGTPDLKVNVANDVLYCLGAFTGDSYPFTVTQDACP